MPEAIVAFAAVLSMAGLVVSLLLNLRLHARLASLKRRLGRVAAERDSAVWRLQVAEQLPPVGPPALTEAIDEAPRKRRVSRVP